tara:strand:+ start:874 stop:1317 length:444 start_codon:yes stop_codon:yes gene_type:complete
MAQGEITLSEGWTVNSQTSFDNFQLRSAELFKEHGYVIFKYSTGKQRTSAQNDAIHLFCRWIADAANNAGYEMKISSSLLQFDVDVPWTMESVKERIWRPLQKAKFPGRKLTRQLLRHEVSEIADVIIRHFGEKRGLVVKFPSKDDL